MEATRQKLAEAQFFYLKLAQANEKLISAEAEGFGFYLSAFLSAARSVTLVLQAERKAQYDAWFPEWRNALPATDQGLLKYFNEQRVATVHQKGAAVASKLKEISPFEFYVAVAREGAQVQIWNGVPGTPAPAQYRTARSLVFEGTEVSAVQASAQYLSLLSQLVSAFGVRFPDANAT